MRRARSVATFLRDVSASKAAQANYRRRAMEISDLAVQEAAEGKPIHAAKHRYYASIALEAARNEFFDPEPEDR